ncbi:hypothetical protein [Kineococcus rubinsiae]|uniref:hypothetical protein n=1 Tax=Kineococcus rubinsiae TaxID=2609562 RepID=UPI001432060E|nr:hypothetical protein [Kineococcus rubinsiae]NIZ93275.1 hypothetical protein [Kineococcus rubinsiae]
MASSTARRTPPLSALVPLAALAVVPVLVLGLAMGPWRLLVPVLVAGVVLVLRPKPTTAVALAVVALPLTALLRRLTAGEDAYLPSDPLAVLAVVVALPAFVLVRGKGREAPGSGWLAVYLAWLVVTAGLSSSGSIATRATGFLIVAVPAGVGYLVARGWAAGSEGIALRSLVVLALPLAAYATAQFFLAPTWDMAWLTSVQETLNSVGSPVARGFRVWGTMESPLSLAMYLGQAVLALLCWMLARRGAPGRGARSLFVTVTLVVVLLALVLTSVRSVLFALPVLLLGVALLGLLPVGRVQALLAAVGVTLAMVVGIGSLGLSATGTTASRYQLSSLGQDQSLLDRAQLLPQFLQAAANPVGTGPGSAGAAQSLTAGGKAIGIDNGYLSLLQEGGVLRLGLFVAVLLLALMAAVRNARRRPDDAGALFAVTVIVFYGILQASSDVVSGTGSFFFWICVGASFAREGAHRRALRTTPAPAGHQAVKEIA